MRRCVIVGGADIVNYERVSAYVGEDDYVIYCDSGLKHRANLHRKPNLIVGDFDSHENPHLDIETIVLPCEKDDTDTVFAVKEAVKRGFTDFLLIGVVGARLDHTLGNIYVLEYLSSLGLTGRIVDDYSEMEYVTSASALVEDSFPYFSTINISGVTRNISIENAKYPLHNAEIQSGYQYGISNEVLPGKTAKITVGEGSVLLIKVFK